MLSDINGVRVGIVQAVTFSRRLKAAGLSEAYGQIPATLIPELIHHKNYRRFPFLVFFCVKAAWNVA